VRLGFEYTVGGSGKPIVCMCVYLACLSEKMLLWMCVIRSPPGEYSITKHTWSGVWKHPYRFTKKG